MEENKSDFTVTILGCGSAMPDGKHYPSAQLVQYKGAQYICDAGECLQYQLDKVHASTSKVRVVFITHLHGDHVFGLIGYLMMLGIQRRKEILHIYGPQGLAEFIQHQIDMMCPYMGFEIIFHEVMCDAVIYEDNYVYVESVRMRHKKMDCYGYIFREKISNSIHIDIQKIEEYGIEKKNINFIKENFISNPEQEIEVDSHVIRPADFCFIEEKNSRSFAYCTDNSFERTKINEDEYSTNINSELPLVQKLKGVNVLYHEASFMKPEMENAIRYGHSTAEEAGMLAKEAGVNKLIIGHISARYGDEEYVLNEAKFIFDNTYLADEFKVFQIE